MAAVQLNRTRRALLGAAAALPVVAVAAPGGAAVADALAGRACWSRALARYRRLAEAKREATERGWFRQANDLYARAMEAIAAAPGADAAGAEGEARRAAAWDRMSAAEDAFYEGCTAPARDAAAALILVPAPDLDAVRDKIAVLRAAQLIERDELEPDWLAALDADLAALAAVAAPLRHPIPHHPIPHLRSEGRTGAGAAGAGAEMRSGARR